jgi:hypothetical protein
MSYRQPRIVATGLDGGEVTAGRGPLISLATMVAVLLIVTSTFERVQVDVGSYSLNIAHVIGIALLPIFFWQQADVRAVRSAMLWFLVFVSVVALPALIVNPAAARLSYLLQICLNGYTLVITFALLKHLDLRAMRQVVRWSTAMLVAIAALQVALAPELSASEGQRIAGLVRPIALFEESTWLAIVAALLFCVALALRTRVTALVLLALVVAIFTRSAAVLAAGAIVLLIPGLQSRPWVRTALVLGPMAFALWFSLSAILTDSETSGDTTSLQSRASDISIVRLANDDQLLPWGGRVLEVYDFDRSRALPSTSNVLPFDLLWKFGVGGILVFAGWCLVVMRILPKRSGGSWSIARAAPLMFGMAMVPVVVQLNNAFGRAWMWVLLALMMAALSFCAPNHKKAAAASSLH